MDFLDSPLDANAINYLSFGLSIVVNNLWTWVAVITAAVSFWRIRGSGSSVVCPDEPCCDASSHQLHPNPDDVLSSASESNAEDRVVNEQRNPVSEQTAPVKVQVGSRVVDDDCVTKGKLTLYYYDDNATPSCSETMMIDEEMEELHEASGDECEWWQSWERMLRYRAGDNGWYNYQDLTVNNGNVVRFWDCRRSGNLVRRSPSCVVW